MGVFTRKVKVLKNVMIFRILVSNYTKHIMGITNINFIFDQMRPLRWESVGKRPKFKTHVFSNSIIYRRYGFFPHHPGNWGIGEI